MGTMQQEFEDYLATEMSRAMDFEVLADVMCRFGWHLIELDRYTDNHHAIDVREWVGENCRGEHRSHGAAWLFKEQADAVLFKLKWG
jgi:hypothetical protein